MDTNDRVYPEFMEWMAQSWYGLPAPAEAESFVRARYAPDVAKLLTGMPFTPAPAEDLARAKGMDADVLRARLDILAREGLVFKSMKGDLVLYALNDIFMQIRAFGWPGRDDEHSRYVARNANAYWERGFLEPWTRTEHKGLRAIPIGMSVADPRTVAPYEDLAKIMDSFEFYSVSVCPCRHIKNLDPSYKKSSAPMEVCLHFDRLGRYTVENGMGREISRDEALDILKKSADAGLVHGISNQQEKPDTICNCDREYCMWFTLYHRLGHAMSLVPSSRVIRANPATCKACGLCVKRCPTDALALAGFPGGISKNGKAAFADAAKCIGCGVCAHACPTQSLSLAPRAAAGEPPRTGKDFVKLTFADFRKVD